MDQKSRTSRREFLETVGAISLGIASGSLVSAAAAENAVLVNHAGYLPGSSKICLVKSATGHDGPFRIINASAKKAVFLGQLIHTAGDLGDYRAGEFSKLDAAGDYWIESGTCRSVTFTVGKDVGLDPVQKAIGYFARQRCGGSSTGYHAPCHLDDGRRGDNGRHQGAVGGWHDACDVRKWVSATIYGMLGLIDAADLFPDGPVHRAIVDELRWGNAYFLSMQEPAGYVMNYCGGDDGNVFTDNLPGTDDDRVIHTNPCEVTAQFHFIAAQAGLFRLLEHEEPAYAQTCRAAAKRCLNWCVARSRPRGATGLAAAVSACIRAWQVFNDPQFGEFAVDCAKQLIARQVPKSAGDAALPGMFLTSPIDREPVREIMHGNLPLLAMCDLLSVLPQHPDAQRWRETLALHVEHVKAMAARSAFGIIPFGVYSQNPGGNRKIGNYWYRYFMRQTGEDNSTSTWWVGTNAHLASNGLGLVRASRILGDAGLAAIAQRQLDWILGGNPFNASTMSGVGANQPALYRNRTLNPPTPVIPGGVMNGLGGSPEDECICQSGEWTTCEYWTPMVSYVMRLAAAMRMF
jgi:hypothetical protein